MLAQAAVIILAEVTPKKLEHENPPPLIGFWSQFLFVRNCFFRADRVVEVLWVVYPLNVVFFLLLVQNSLSHRASLKSGPTPSLVSLGELAFRNLAFSRIQTQSLPDPAFSNSCSSVENVVAFKLICRVIYIVRVCVKLRNSVCLH